MPPTTSLSNTWQRKLELAVLGKERWEKRKFPMFDHKNVYIGNVWDMHVTINSQGVFFQPLGP